MAKFYYGGQAVMEGVMMRGRTSAAVAVRQPNGNIYLYEEALNPRLYQNRLIRLGLLIGYLYLIGRIPDIQRIFGYHGAEHKAINAMERGDPLDFPHVRQASRVHTRCGTGFLLLVVVISIVVFALVGSPSFLVKIVSRVLLIPVVAAVAYELMRLGAANYRYRIVRWLLAPGLALQGLTTREPDDSMIECAIAALNRVIRRDEMYNNREGVVDPALPPLVASR